MSSPKPTADIQSTAHTRSALIANVFVGCECYITARVLPMATGLGLERPAGSEGLWGGTRAQGCVDTPSQKFAVKSEIHRQARDISLIRLQLRATP